MGDLEIEVFQEQAADVGGDFYAYHEIGEDSLLVAVGDASGKGIPAALESARVCTLLSLKAQSCRADDLGKWLADLNGVIQATAEKAGTLTTLVVLLRGGSVGRISLPCLSPSGVVLGTNICAKVRLLGAWKRMAAFNGRLRGSPRCRRFAVR